MKPMGPHPRDRLKPATLWKLPDGRHADGGGLYLLVDGGSRRWLLRTTILGRRRDMGLGSLRDVPLAEARELARHARRTAKANRDPIVERRREEGVPTFAEATDSVWKARSAEFRSDKHAKQWISALKTYGYPTLGELRVDRIGNDDILRVVEPIWVGKRTTASKVLQRIKAILNRSIVNKHRDGPNPADIVTKALSKSRPKVRHHPALPYDRLSDYIRDLHASAAGGEMARLAVEFCILTALRKGTVRKAKRAEIDGAAACNSAAALTTTNLKGRLVMATKRSTTKALKAKATARKA
jgi:hypothetical protein